MQKSIAIIGAGIAGMCTALSLAKSGAQITVLERDVPPPEGDVNNAFFEWQRRGAAQFRHPHAFLGLMCSLLEEHHPQLLEEFFAAGARRLSFADMVPPKLLDQYEAEPDDDKMWMILCRRATIETVLRRHVESIHNISIQNAMYVTGVQVEQRNDGPHMTALELTDRQQNNHKTYFKADLFVDASGRASKFRQWLHEQNIEIPEQKDDAEIVYYTRHYQLKPGVCEPDRHKNEPAAGDLGYMKYGVFPGENGHFAVIICVPKNEQPLRTAIKDGDQFDDICRQIPGLLPWIGADQSTATTTPFGIGDIQAVWRDFVTDDAPKVLDFFAVGDASVRTNPLYGRGCSTGILHGQVLADVLAKEADPRERALKFAKLTEERIRPIFDASLTEDKNGIKRAEAVRRGQDNNQASSLKKWFGLAFGDALAAAAGERIHVYRGMMRTVNLLEKPGAFLQDPKIKRTIFRYMLRGRKRNARARVQRGPAREEMMQHIANLSS